MGKLYLLIAIEKIRQKIKTKTDFNPSSALIDKIINNLHPEQGFKLLTAWHIPENYAAIARYHHNAEFDHSNLLLTVVRLVNNVTIKLEQNDPQEDTGSIAGSVEADILGLGEIVIAELEIAIEETMKHFL